MLIRLINIEISRLKKVEAKAIIVGKGMIIFISGNHLPSDNDYKNINTAAKRFTTNMYLSYKMK